MSLFGDLDLNNVDEDDALGLPNDTYSCVLTEVNVALSKDGSKNLARFTYRVSDGERVGETVSEFKTVPASLDTLDERKQAAYLKVRLLSLGVPESQVGTVELDDLIGTDCLVTTRRKGEYVNVAKVTVDDSVATF